MLLDADGINAFRGRPEALAEAQCEIVLTPHAGELSRLLGLPVEDIAGDPVRAAKKADAVTGNIVLLKGAPTIIAGPGGEIWMNPTGNESMATAGMGDVLTGTIAGFAAQGLTLFDAAKLGAYIHGRAGELASEIYGIHGVIAGDVLDLLAHVLNDVSRNR